MEYHTWESIKEKTMKQKPHKFGNFSYTLMSDGTVRIERYKGSEEEVIIPEQVYGHKVTEIRTGAFRNRRKLETVTLPEGVQKIGKRVFLNCKKLTLVELPESLTQIGDSAFANCRSLGSIIFPDGITYVCRKTFSGCWNLEQVMLPEGLTGI